jgi:uncharacterized iron-regulated membrane protein
MTTGDLALLCLAVAMAAFTAWALWPRRRLRAGPENNWQQRSATEIDSAKTDATGGNIAPVTVAFFGLHGSGLHDD